MFKSDKEQKKALKHLQKDPILKKVIAEHEFPSLPDKYDLFQDIIESVIGQQLSTKAAATIRDRFVKLFDSQVFPTPKQVLQVDVEKVRAAGLSYSKIKYIKGFAQEVMHKRLDLEQLKQAEDEIVIEELIKIKGIGRWTAEMILMFSLKRPDVFSMGDLGLRNAVAQLYKIDRDDFRKIEKITLRWKPYRTLASRYLWKTLDNVPK